MKKQPNVLIILVDQLRAISAPPFETQVPMPHLDMLRKSSVEFNNALAICPLCTPARGMMMTGRYPQSTGMIVNFTSTRSDEIGMADAFAHAGYRTGYVGKWHLNRGGFPNEQMDWVPEGRARLGWEYWRAYNCHVDFWEGHLNKEDWRTEQWQGYETEGLLHYTNEFLDQDDDKPWLLCLAPHQPHWNWADTAAPDECYAALPKELKMPKNVPDYCKDTVDEHYRHYMAMMIALDKMIEEVLAKVGEDTLVVFTSDHGTMMGAHAKPEEDGNCWGKLRPQEESIHIPGFVRWNNNLDAGRQVDELFTHVDLFPTLCGLCGIPIPRTVEGIDFSPALRGEEQETTRDATLIMGLFNFAQSPNYLGTDGNEWRGVRTHTHTYVRWREGAVELYDNAKDPLQMNNLAGKDSIEQELSDKLDELLSERHDDVHPGSYYADWYDHERRVVKNAFGDLPHPDTQPNWALLYQ